MGRKMKNLSIFGVHRKISFRGVHKKPVYIRGLAEKGELGQGFDTPMHIWVFQIALRGRGE